jgi:hypothetical protein
MRAPRQTVCGRARRSRSPRSQTAQLTWLQPLNPFPLALDAPLPSVAAAAASASETPATATSGGGAAAAASASAAPRPARKLLQFPFLFGKGPLAVPALPSGGLFPGLSINAAPAAPMMMVGAASAAPSATYGYDRPYPVTWGNYGYGIRSTVAHSGGARGH